MVTCHFRQKSNISINTTTSYMYLCIISTATNFEMDENVTFKMYIIIYVCIVCISVKIILFTFKLWKLEALRNVDVVLETNLTSQLKYSMVNRNLLLTPANTNICITFVQRRPNVFDAGPTLYKCYTSVL